MSPAPISMGGADAAESGPCGLQADMDAWSAALEARAIARGHEEPKGSGAPGQDRI